MSPLDGINEKHIPDTSLFQPGTVTPDFHRNRNNGETLKTSPDGIQVSKQSYVQSEVMSVNNETENSFQAEQSSSSDTGHNDSRLFQPKIVNRGVEFPETVKPGESSGSDDTDFSPSETSSLLVLPELPAQVPPPFGPVEGFQFNRGNNRKNGSGNSLAGTGTVVNVSIGRIEVKAAAPKSNVTETRREKKPSGIMTLETYLRMRANGGNQ